MTDDDFDDPFNGDDQGGGQLVLDLEGFEGPIDVLLSLAREQKVDLTRLSILRLADQYLAYIQTLKSLRLDLAADYLVMAAWLAYLKSRLLLPKDERDPDEPNPEEMADALAFQLRRLEAMRTAGKRLMARPRLGIERFPAASGEELPVIETLFYAAGLVDLLKAYADHVRRQTSVADLKIPPPEVFTIEAAAKRLSAMIGRAVNWVSLLSFLPDEIAGSLLYRSAVASTFAATLEMARSGQLSLRQDNPFGPILVRAAHNPPEA